MLTRCRPARHALSSIIRINTRDTRLSSTTSATPRIIFSGIQPTGVPHLGNYFGALRQWKRIQDSSDSEDKLLFSIVDLHAITIQQDPAQLRRWKDESLAMLLAIGLAPDRSILFHQSDVPSHERLMWILTCQASMGYLSRMTQWKDKTAGEKGDSQRQKLGLFAYPVLQAADVLVHGTTHVPVGSDQAQHLEFAREIAIGFNHIYGNGETILTPPETIISPAARVKSLTDPMSKMSKSSPNANSKILLTDSSQEVEKKIKAALTDSEAGITYDPDSRPGVSNLLDLLYHAKYEYSSVTQQELAKDFESHSLRALKEAVAQAINDSIQPIRESYFQTIENKELLDEVARTGARRASENTLDTMTRVRKSLGLS